MGLAQVPRRFTANHSGATGRDWQFVSAIFPFCSISGPQTCKVFSIIRELMGKPKISTFSSCLSFFRKK
jgi:hypothetical protein